MRKFFKYIFNLAKKYLTIVIIAFIFLFLFICNSTQFKFGNDLINNLKSIATSFTPTTDLFDDGSEVSFVSYFFGMKAKTKKVYELEYYYPVVAQNLSTSDYCLLFNYEGVVNSVAEGRVINVGYSNLNEKYVEIEHLGGKISKFEGLETIGVSMGDYVLSNKPIGISALNKYLKFTLFNENNAINTSEIKWVK